jgi:hypothetical protein
MPSFTPLEIGQQSAFSQNYNYLSRDKFPRKTYWPSSNGASALSGSLSLWLRNKSCLADDIELTRWIVLQKARCHRVSLSLATLVNLLIGLFG